MVISLLHIQRDKSSGDALAKMKELAGGLDSKSSIQFDFIVKQGNVIDEITKVTIEFALLFNSTVHLYSVEKPGVDLSDKIKKNLASAKAEFENHGAAFQKIKESQNSFLVG